MTSGKGRDPAASVKARLLNLPRQGAEGFNQILSRYVAERFLYRLGVSEYRDRFVLKGALLFALWGGDSQRPTRDVDLAGYVGDDAETLVKAFRAICGLEASKDGLVFRTEDLTVEPIRHAEEYHGFRVKLWAGLGTARLRLQVDVGFGDAVVPPPWEADFPSLLPDLGCPRIRAYPREAVVAEKLHAMAALGHSNTRLKDFYDVHVLARRFDFEGPALVRAVTATFTRRRTGMEGETPVALRPRFYQDPDRAARWRRYLEERSLTAQAPPDFDAVGESLRGFLGPVWEASAAGRPFLQTWPAGGPWEVGA